MEKLIKKFTYTLTALLAAVVFIFFSFLAGGGTGVAFAATSVSAAFDSSDVMDDLETATIDGEPFSVIDYPYDFTGLFKHPEIFAVVEYCYSTRASQRSDYGVYIYFYNPQALDISTTSKANKVTMGVKYGKDDNGNTTVENYEKFDLFFCSKSTGDYNNLFYKFKIIDHVSEVDGKTIAERVNSNSRRYDISEVELLTVGDLNATAYSVGGTYTFTGYAKGYGPDTTAESTLSCSSTSFKTLTLDVHPTYFRPQGTHNDGYTQDTLHSVYFSVPNEIIDEYGEMTAVHATWLNAYTAPILVTGNSDIYSALLPYVGEYVDGGTTTDYQSALKYALVATKAVDAVKLEPAAACNGYYGYNCYSDGIDGFVDTRYDNLIYYLNYLFLAENGNADEYVLPAEKILAWFEVFTKRFGGIAQTLPDITFGDDNDGNLITGAASSSPAGTTKSGLINDRYSAVLFDSVDSNFTDATITSTMEYKLTDNTVSDTLWTRLFGGSLKAENSYNISAIQKITGDDISYYATSSAFCNKFYVAESDYVDLCDYIKSAELKDETVYLFRYYQSEYVCHEVSEFERTTTSNIISGKTGYYEGIDTNAYFFQAWYQLDFDVIDLTFSKLGKDTVIPVVMSPCDYGADGTPPVHTTDDTDWRKIIKIILGLLLLVLIVVILMPVISPVLGVVVKGVLWVICAPFKLIAKLFHKKE